MQDSALAITGVGALCESWVYNPSANFNQDSSALDYALLGAGGSSLADLVMGRGVVDR